VHDGRVALSRQPYLRPPWLGDRCCGDERFVYGRATDGQLRRESVRSSRLCGRPGDQLRCTQVRF
jgi:hypothetical protein